MSSLCRLLSLLAPPRCVACGGGCSTPALLCAGCEQSLNSMPAPAGPFLAGLERVCAAAPHDGVARQLVAALKFRGLLPIADLLAARIVDGCPAELIAGSVVPVPPARSRLLRRGFDPAEEIAGSVATLAGLSLEQPLARGDSARQVGRPRAQRLSSPPRVRSVTPAPRDVLLVDDVLTTGATLSACARSLRRAGAERVVALAFARTL